jgi:CIC family chloride channel protein
VVALNEEKDYAGIVQVAEAHAPELDESSTVREILRYSDTHIAADDDRKRGGNRLRQSGGGGARRCPVARAAPRDWLLSESYALRRYAEELELRRKELIGE